ncbi:MAG: hypothetical protein D3906_17040 [Candidatus Electrothrix sp. AUS1_2]|nr:hypothetical protein [Candidatus Electrothrix sp. AUS1_2]
MRFHILIVLIFMIFTVDPVKAEDDFSVIIEPESKALSLLELPTVKHNGTDGYYYFVKVSVSNTSSIKKEFMVDDDCTFSSWKIEGQSVEILSENCLKNIFEKVSLNPGEIYFANLRLWFPKKYSEDSLYFRIGFVEIKNYKEVSKPYWSDFIQLKIR